MDLREVRTGHRKVTGLSGVVSVDGGNDERPDAADQGRRSGQVECGPLLKLPKRDLVAEYEAEMAREQGDAAPAKTESTDSSIESFVALFREITDFADTVYPGSRADDCEITVLVGREKLAFHVVAVDRHDA